MTDIEEVLRRRLTNEQYDAAVDPAGEVLCLACAGSGKSRTLAYRIARLLARGAEPKSIVAFTFTEKAADAIKLRVAQALGAAGMDAAMLGAIYVGTIHSYCQHVLCETDARYRQFEVLDENRLRLFIISRMRRLEITTRPNEYFKTINEIASAWKLINDEMLSLDAVLAEDPGLGNIMNRLSTLLDADEFIDFSLMIRLVVDALRREDRSAVRAVDGLRHLMVDEYQDVNPSQEALIQALHRRSETLFVVGDDDQSIYGWRGADVGNILTFAERYPGCSQHRLNCNFRSIPAIVTVAEGFASAELGPSRIEKEPRAEECDEPRDFRGA
jgi:DNA helicase-2/ATP-dependent DNA helicase PcrA